MNLLSELAETLADRALGFSESVPYDVDRDLAVPMPDGVVLRGDRYRPSGSRGALPVVLIRTPYGRGGLGSLAMIRPYARRGFQVFAQSTRGTFGSGGQFRPFTTECEDGLTTVDWLRAQSWCDGRVSTVGGSYLGHTQWAVAPYADPPLVSASLNITGAAMTATFYQDGAPALRNSLSWTATIGTQERRGLPGLLRGPLLTRKANTLIGRRRLEAADVEVSGAPVAFWRDFLAHAEPGDTFWDRADHSGADLAAMPPVSMVTGWWDLFVQEQLRDVPRLTQAGVPVRILIGPWLHAEPAELKAIVRSDVEWLHHHLDGAPAPQGAPVRVNLMPTDRWLDLPSWPPPAARPTGYVLGAAGTLAPESPESPGSGASPAGSDGFTFDPDDPTPTVGGPLLSPPGKQVDNAEVERRHDVLTYTTEQLPGDLDVVGVPSARIRLRTSLAYADLFVRVCDVDESGVSRNVVDGIRRMRPGDLGVADTVREVEVELFPTAYRFAGGHRIRVQVAGGAFPRFARNPGTGAPLGSAAPGRTSRFEVFHDAATPSRVIFPVIG